MLFDRCSRMQSCETEMEAVAEAKAVHKSEGIEGQTEHCM